MTELYLVRHGETFDNERQIMQGQTQGELNPTGIRQAEELSLQLADVPFDAVVASDLWRSIQTARILAEPHHLDVVTTPLLRERDWGSFTGIFIPDLKDRKPWPDDIESLPTMKDRARRFLRFISKTYPNQQVLAVGHGIINKAIQAVFWGKEMHEIEKMKNAEVRILDISL